MTYHIMTHVSLKLGSNVDYSEMMHKLLPIMAGFGWTLTIGLQPMTGDFTQLIHVWEVAEFDDIRRGLEGCATDPAALDILSQMPRLLHTEELSIMVKTPYAP